MRVRTWLPKNQEQKILPRLPQSVVIHRDTYQPLNLKEIDQYDKTLNRVAGPPKARYPEKFGEPKKARGQKMSHGKQQCSSVQIFETRVRGWVYLGSRANSRSATNVSDSHISQ